ncbi:MAG: hypothetical protein H7Z43_10000, partial [Clostridia bacterium]|nr:hypothetical protein [Deltaproteobacteria bacterium]
PENILVCDDGHPLIIDFGAAALAASGRAAPGAIVGSPPYVPPERIRGMATLESPGDMYALGATLYHALVGSPPFARATPRDMLLAHLYQSPLSVFAAMPDVPADLGKLVMRLLEKTPERRFTSWAEASEQFAACRADAAQNRPIRIMA